MVDQKNEYMMIYIKVAKISQMLHPEKANVKLRIVHFVLSLIMFTTGCITVWGLTNKIIMNPEDIDGVASTIELLTGIGVAMFRLCYFYIREDAYNELLNVIHSKFLTESMNVRGPKLDMKRYWKVGMGLALAAHSFGVIYAMQQCLTAVFIYLFTSDIKYFPLILDTIYPFDMDNGLNRMLVIVSQAFSWVSLCNAFMVSDALWYLMVVLTIGQLNIIIHSLKHLELETIKGDYISKEWDAEANKVLLECLKHHERIRRFLNSLEDFTSLYMLMDFLHFFISMIFILLGIIIKAQSKEWSGVALLLEYMTISVVRNFALALLGTEIVELEEKIASALFHCSWYQSMKTTKHEIIMGTKAARNPIKFTAGKFFSFTLEFFMSAMQSIFSYFMVFWELRSNQTEN